MVDCSKRVNKSDSLDDHIGHVGAIGLPVCTKITFCKFWGDRYDTLAIKKYLHDTCGVCYLLKNALSSLKQRDIQGCRRETR